MVRKTNGGVGSSLHYNSSSIGDFWGAHRRPPIPHSPSVSSLASETASNNDHLSQTGSNTGATAAAIQHSDCPRVGPHQQQHNGNRHSRQLSASSSVTSGTSQSYASSGLPTSAANQNMNRLHDDALRHCDDEQLAELLERMMDHMGFDEPRRLALRQLPKESKIVMLKQHHAKEGSAATSSMLTNSPSATSGLAITNSGMVSNSLLGSADRSTPEYSAKQLMENLQRIKSPTFSSHALCKLLISLRINITSQPIGWIQEFIDIRGLATYLRLFEVYLQRQKRKDMDHKLELEFLRCFKALMNNKPGLQEIMSSSPRSIDVVVRCIESENFHSRRLVPELLTVVCYTDPPCGHRMVLESFENLRRSKSEDDRALIFQSWMRSFQTAVDKKSRIGGGKSDGMIAGVGWIGDSKITDKELMDYLVSNMMLLNSIVSLAEDLDYRMYLRNRFFAVGFSNIRSRLFDFCASNEYLNRQFEKFNDDLNSDWLQYQEIYYEIKELQTDPINIVRNLVRSTEGTMVHVRLVSILQNLLAVRQDEDTRAAYFHLIETVTSQIVLDGKGIDPDFSSTFNLNFADLIERFVERQELERAQSDIVHLQSLLEQMMEEMVAMRSRGVDSFHDGKDLAVERRLKGFSQRLKAITERISNGQVRSSGTAASASDANGADLSSVSSTSVLAPDASAKHQTDAETAGSIGIPAPPCIPLPPPPPPPPPPPGPSMTPTGNAKKPAAYKSSSKLKPLRWDKLAQNEIESTIWVGCNEKEIVESLKSAEFWRDLEQKFKADDKAISKISSTSRNTLTNVANSKMKELSVINPKKAYNLTILLSKIKHSPIIIRKAICLMDRTVLSANHISQLIKFLPSPEEVGLLCGFKDEIPENLAKADCFLVEMLRMDRYDLYLRIFDFKNSFEERSHDILEGCKVVRLATESIKKSDSLKALMELILVVGNVMNNSSFRGGAHGFRVGSLNSLIDTKANDDRTLLQYLVELIDQRFPRLVKVLDDIELSGPASRVSISAVKQDCANLRNASTAFVSDMERYRRMFADQPDDENRLFWESASPFLLRAKETADQLHKDLEFIWEEFEGVLRYFGEDPNEMTSEAFFGIFKTFAVSFRKALDAVGADKETENNESRKNNCSTVSDARPTTNHALIHTEKANSCISNAAVEPALNDCDRSVMDSLIESLKNGYTPNIMKNLPDVPGIQHKEPRKPIQSLYRRSSLGHYSQQAMSLLETIKAEE